MPCYEKLIDSRRHEEETLHRPEGSEGKALPKVENPNHLVEVVVTLHLIHERDGALRSLSKSPYTLK